MTSPYNPQPPPRRQHTLRNVLLFIAGLFAVLIAVSAIASAGRTPARTVHNPLAIAGGFTPPASTAPASPGIGDTVYDGDFAFTVTGQTCGAAAAAEIDQDGTDTVPPGAAECIFTVTVTNDKAAAQTFFDSAQYAFDAAGRQYSADPAGLFMPGDASGRQVNPGITITAQVPFQFPAGARIVRLVLHDSAFSGGVAVRV